MSEDTRPDSPARAAESAAAGSAPDDTGRPSPMPDGKAQERAGAILPLDRDSLREIVKAAIADFTRQPGPALRDRITEVLWPLLEHAQAAAAGSHEGIRLWMLDCGELVSKHRARAEAAEAKAAHAVRLAERWALLALAEGPITEKDAQAIRAELAALRGDAQDGGEREGGAGDDWSFTDPAL